MSVTCSHGMRLSEACAGCEVDARPTARAWTSAEKARLRAYYDAAGNEPVDLHRLAASMGRTHASVALVASRAGLGNLARNKVLGGAKLSPLPAYASAEERNAATSERMQRHYRENEHPRGALGMKHTPEARAAISANNKRAWADANSGHWSKAARQRRSDLMAARNRTTPASSAYSRTAGGRRDDLGGLYVRSAWEANYARYLNLLLSQGTITGWEYEPKTFVFERISRGTRSYQPDFRVTFPDGSHEWHEVKGWMDPKSKTKLDRMARYFPEEKVVVIGESWFRQARRGALAASIPHWESQGRGSRGC